MIFRSNHNSNIFKNMTSNSFTDLIDPIALVKFDDLQDHQPTHALVENTDLVILGPKWLFHDMPLCAA